MKLFIVLCLAAVVVAAPAPAVLKIEYPKNEVEILRQENERFDDGYRYLFEQSDGTKQEQNGKVYNQGTDDEYIELKGSFSWVGPDGVTYTVNYTADQEGYKPEIEQGPGGGVPPAVIATLLGSG